METVIVGAIVLAVLCLAIRSMIKSRKKGGCSACGGGCGGSCCHSPNEHHKKYKKSRYICDVPRLFTVNDRGAARRPHWPSGGPA